MVEFSIYCYRNVFDFKKVELANYFFIHVLYEFKKVFFLKKIKKLRKNIIYKII